MQFKPDGDILKNLEIFQIRNGSAVRVGLYLLAEDELVWNVTEAELFPGISVKPIILSAQRISIIAVHAKTPMIMMTLVFSCLDLGHSPFDSDRIMTREITIDPWLRSVAIASAGVFIVASCLLFTAVFRKRETE